MQMDVAELCIKKKDLVSIFSDCSDSLLQRPWLFGSAMRRLATAGGKDNGRLPLPFCGIPGFKESQANESLDP